MANELSGLRVTYLTSDEGMEQVELTTPQQATTPDGIEHAYYGAVVVRGGVSDGDLLRTASAAVGSFQALYEADMLAGGQQVRVAADVVRGQTRTSWPSAQFDIKNAGGRWVESSGRPGGPPAFWTTLTRVFSRRSQSA